MIYGMERRRGGEGGGGLASCSITTLCALEVFVRASPPCVRPAALYTQREGRAGGEENMRGVTAGEVEFFLLFFFSLSLLIVSLSGAPSKRTAAGARLTSWRPVHQTTETQVPPPSDSSPRKNEETLSNAAAPHSERHARSCVLPWSRPRPPRHRWRQPGVWLHVRRGGSGCCAQVRKKERERERGGERDDVAHTVGLLSLPFSTSSVSLTHAAPPTLPLCHAQIPRSGRPGLHHCGRSARGRPAGSRDRPARGPARQHLAAWVGGCRGQRLGGRGRGRRVPG